MRRAESNPEKRRSKIRAQNPRLHPQIQRPPVSRVYEVTFCSNRDTRASAFRRVPEKRSWVLCPWHIRSPLQCASRERLLATQGFRQEQAAQRMSLPDKKAVLLSENQS